MNYSLLIVGARFRPPAEDILNNLAAGTPLLLRRQPQNPHDANAIQVLLDWKDEGLLEALVLQCAEEASAEVENPIHLGFIPRDHAAALASTFDAKQTPIMGEGDEADVVQGFKSSDVKGKLVFSLTGKAEVQFDV
jgi:hypothetical protein